MVESIIFGPLSSFGCGSWAQLLNSAANGVILAEATGFQAAP